MKEGCLGRCRKDSEGAQRVVLAWPRGVRRLRHLEMRSPAPGVQWGRMLAAHGTIAVPAGSRDRKHVALIAMEEQLGLGPTRSGVSEPLSREKDREKEGQPWLFRMPSPRKSAAYW